VEAAALIIPVLLGLPGAIQAALVLRDRWRD